MKEIEVISFDAEGTVVTPDFSQAIWHEAIPAIYARKKGFDLAQAKKCIYEAVSYTHLTLPTKRIV